MRCTIGDVDMMEVPLPLHEATAPPPGHAYSRPQHHNDDDDDNNGAPPSPTPALSALGLGPLFQQGFVDCAQEAVRFLTEEEGLSDDDPLVLGLRQHLLLHLAPALPPTQSARSHTLPGGHPTQAFSPPTTDSHPTVGKHQLDHVTVTSSHVDVSAAFASHHRRADESKSDHSSSRALSELSPAGAEDSEALVTEGDLAGVLSCLTYLHPARAQNVHHQHACRQVELLPSRARELSFTSSDSDVDSSLNASGFASVSDGEGFIASASDVDAEDMAVSDNDSVFVSSTNSDVDHATQGASSDVVTSCACRHNVTTNHDPLSDTRCLCPLVSPTSAAAVATTTTTTLESPLSLLSPLVETSGAGLTAEEARIRSLAREILVLLNEPEDSDLDDGDVSDDAFDLDPEDMVIEIEQ